MGQLQNLTIFQPRNTLNIQKIASFPKEPFREFRVLLPKLQRAGQPALFKLFLLIAVVVSDSAHIRVKNGVSPCGGRDSCVCERAHLK